MTLLKKGKTLALVQKGATHLVAGKPALKKELL